MIAWGASFAPCVRPSEAVFKIEPLIKCYKSDKDWTIAKLAMVHSFSALWL